MKKRLLIVVLCFACVASFAQTKKKVTSKKRAATAEKPAVATPAPVDTPPPVVTTPPPVDAAQGVKFEAPLDGYYKKTNLAQAKPTPYANIRENDAFLQNASGEILMFAKK